MDSLKSFAWKYRYVLLFSGVGIVYFFNLFIDIMEVDAAQYASMSREMAETKSYLHVYEHGSDYLDKPPMLFWLSSLSISVFGAANWSYKLPSVLILLLGLYSTFRFAKLYYSVEISRLATLILATTQAYFLITNDIRTDGMLLGFTIFTLWQFAEYLKNRKWLNFLLTSIGIACGMMTKGPIILIVFLAGFGVHFLLHKQWRDIFNPRWILLLLLVGIFLLPMCYGLYTQFDLHPEKEVYGLKGPSGLKFFFWTQSFGRITGENYWDNDSGYFFFTHSILWDFQPWIFFFIPALILRIKQFFINLTTRKHQNIEYITLGGFVLVFIALSLSRYKLPHYIFVIFPLASIITASFIYRLKESVIERWSKIHFGFMHLFWLIIPVGFVLVFPLKNWTLPFVLALIFLLAWRVFLALRGKIERVFIPIVILGIGFNLMMATYFYPNLLSFQGSSQLGKLIHQEKWKVYLYSEVGHALYFYGQQNFESISINGVKNAKTGTKLFVTQEGLEEVKRIKDIKIVKKIGTHRASIITFPFLIKTTRPQQLKNEYIIEII